MDEVLKRRYRRKSAFLEWCDRDGLSVLTGFGDEDRKSAPIEHWERLGGPAACCHMESSRGLVGVLIGEIPAGRSRKAMRHMYEEQVLIISGRGASHLQQDDEPPEIPAKYEAEMNKDGLPFRMPPV